MYIICMYVYIYTSNVCINMYYICIGHEDLSRTTDALNLANYINLAGSVDLKIQTQAEDMA